MEREKINFVWWYYFWLLTALIAISPIFFEAAEDWVRWIAAIPALVGLWGYLRRRPLGHRYLWTGYFCLIIVDILYGWIFESSVDIPPDFQFGFRIFMVVGFALILPLYFALWRYAFRSPDIWRHVARAA